MSTLVPVTGEIRDYAWGAPGGVAKALGGDIVDSPQAELWLGAHPSAPSHTPDGDLLEWEEVRGEKLPFLLKVLAAAAPLSLQAHPTPAQARDGFARENALGIDLGAPNRNYKDAFAKPELIVAVDDGFQALCGFRPEAESAAELRSLAAASSDPAPILAWADVVAGEDGLRRAVLQALRGETPGLVAALSTVEHPLIQRLIAFYPGDPGVAVALLLHHVTLAAGESLWLPAGNVHAYLDGTGVELMGPSDNVLRGGLTPKHVDVEELAHVLDFTGGPTSFLPAVPLGAGVVTYRPASVASGAGVDFELLLFTASAAVVAPGAAVGVVVEGSFTVSAGGETATYDRGATFLIADGGTVDVSGSGRLFLATGGDAGLTVGAVTSRLGFTIAPR